MGRGIRVLAAVALLPGIVIVEEVVRSQYQQPIEFVIFESDKQDHPVKQAVAWSARRVLMNLRPTDEDIQQLNGDAGARLTVNLRDQAFAKALLERFTERGLELDALDRSHQWTAVQAVAIEGNLAAVKLLLDKGAEPRKTGSDGRSLIELLNRLAKQEPDKDYPAIIRALQ